VTWRTSRACALRFVAHLAVLDHSSPARPLCSCPPGPRPACPVAASPWVTSPRLGSPCLDSGHLVSGHLASPRVTSQGVSYADNQASWWHKQLEGTVDIDCGPRSDWFHGGLQFQTIHHLYPRLPRFALRAVSREVDVACAQSGLVYNKTANFATANRLVLDTLVKTAHASKSAALADGPGAPLLWDAFNARG
jgi:hypothetical protein